MPAKFDRCVKGVKKSSKGKVNPYAVCNASIKDNKSLDLIGKKIVESIYKKVLGNDIPSEVLDKVIEEAKAQGLDPNLALAVLSEKAYRQDPKPSQDPGKTKDSGGGASQAFMAPVLGAKLGQKGVGAATARGLQAVGMRVNAPVAAGLGAYSIGKLGYEGIKAIRAKKGAEIARKGAEEAESNLTQAKAADAAQKARDIKSFQRTSARYKNILSTEPTLVKKSDIEPSDATFKKSDVGISDAPVRKSEMKPEATPAPSSKPQPKNTPNETPTRTTPKNKRRDSDDDYSVGSPDKKKKKKYQYRNPEYLSKSYASNPSVDRTHTIEVDEQIHEFVKSVKLNEGVFKRILKRGAKAVGKGLLNVAKEVALSPLTVLKAAGSQARDEFERRTNPASYESRKELEAQANFEKQQQQNAERAAAKEKAKEVKKRAITQAGFRANRLASEKAKADAEAKRKSDLEPNAFYDEWRAKKDKEKEEANKKLNISGMTKVDMGSSEPTGPGANTTSNFKPSLSSKAPGPQGIKASRKKVSKKLLGGNPYGESIITIGQKIVEGVLRRVNEMKVNPMIDRKEVRRMKAAGVSKKARREFTADDVARKESDKKIKASMGPNNPKNTFKPKPKLNNKYIERGKKGKSETPMTKAQIDRSGTGGKPAAGRPGQTKAGVLKAKLAKIDRTSTAFMANLAKNPKNSEK